MSYAIVVMIYEVIVVVYKIIIMIYAIIVVLIDGPVLLGAKTTADTVGPFY